MAWTNFNNIYITSKLFLYFRYIIIVFMSEIVIVIIGAIVLVGGVILYAVISTATGLEEDANKNYIPDWIERKFPSIFKSSKDLD